MISPIALISKWTYRREEIRHSKLLGDFVYRQHCPDFTCSRFAFLETAYSAITR